MGYCFMTFDKIKTTGRMRAKYMHNYREKEVSNADPNTANLNEELIEEARTSHGTYQDAWDKRMAELPYYKNHKVRKNGVLGLEVVTTFSRSERDNIDLEAWKKQNVEWLKKTFNHAKDGKNNVLSVMYHGDEAGNVHCHAFVIPIDENGKLNASRYIDGSKVCSDMQTSYADAMEPFGLERGLKKSHAKHKDIRKYYADLNQALDVPSPYLDETAMEYKNRLLEELRTARAATKRKCDEEERRHTEILTEKYNQEHYAIEKEFRTATIDLERRIRSLTEKEQRLIQNVSALAEQEDSLQKSIQSMIQQYGDPETLQKKAAFYDDFQTRFELLSQENPGAAQDLQEIIEEMNELYLQELQDNISLD